MARRYLSTQAEKYEGDGTHYARYLGETPFDMHLPNRHGLTAWDYVMFKKETDKEIVDVVKMHIAEMTK